MEDLLRQNKDWAIARLEKDPEFYSTLEKVQKPDYL